MKYFGVKVMKESYLDILEDKVKTPISSNVAWEEQTIFREIREKRHGHKGHCLWLTGLSGSGKSTLAREIQNRLFEEGKLVYILDGDNVRHGLNGDLGFTEKDRDENIRRVGHVSQLLFDAGNIVLCSFISPSKKMRDYVRTLYPDGAFSEVYLKTSLEVCIKRDPKGLYKKAINGEIRNFTGIDSEYEAPESAEIEIDTDVQSISESVQAIIGILNK
jgi:adenylyl-sulfate kinase